MSEERVEYEAGDQDEERLRAVTWEEALLVLLRLVEWFGMYPGFEREVAALRIGALAVESVMEDSMKEVQVRSPAISVMENIVKELQVRSPAVPVMEDSMKEMQVRSSAI